MNYRKFSDKIDFVPSALGFGLMRLPIKDGHTVDVDESVRMVRYAIDRGVNYLDTAYMYHGGESEKVMAKVLKDGYREKVKIADKFPMWMLNNESDKDRIFNEQLQKLEVEKIDFYLLHALSKDSHEKIVNFEMIDWLKQKRAQGKIDYIGFSFHDDFEYLKQVIELHDWDFCMLQFNFMDVATQLNLSALKYVREKNMGLIVMEPLRGGQLTISIPDDIAQMWKQFGDTMHKDTDTPPSPAQYMLDWVWHFEEVSFAISGMSNIEQVRQNIEYAEQSKIGKYTPEQMALIDKIREMYQKRIAINCTDCKYCTKDCPQKIAIPYIFNQINECQRYQSQKTPTFRYGFLPESQRANKCIDCKVCIPLCPQKLDIPTLLQKSSKVFDEKQAYNEIQF